MKNLFVGLFAFAVMLLGVADSAMAAVVLPDPGVDVGGHLTAAITALGPIVIIAVGGYFAWMLVRMGIRWGGKALGGR